MIDRKSNVPHGRATVTPGPDRTPHFIIFHRGNVYGHIRGYAYDPALHIARVVFPDLEPELKLHPWQHCTPRQHNLAIDGTSLSPESIRRMGHLQTPEQWAHTLQSRFTRCDKQGRAQP